MSKGSFYIPSLDGVRALAVMLVFFSHTGFSHIVPGGLGVTAFFFLSGFLITTLLRVEYRNTGSLNFKNFYLRRVYRIFPPLYIVLLMTLALCLLGVFRSELSGWGLFSQFFHLTNYHIVVEGKAGMLPGLGVLWSLAVEEHFYLVFPIVFLMLMRRVELLSTAAVLVGVCVVVLIWRFCALNLWGLPDGYPDSGVYAYAYYATDTRIDSLLYGCIMALAFNPSLKAEGKESAGWSLGNSWWLPPLLVAGGVGLLIFTLLYRDPAFRETLRYSLQGIAFLPLFYFAIAKSDWIIFKPLNWAPIVYLGKLSYTFYLSHYVLIYLVIKIFGDGLIAKNVGGFVFTFIFSALMYHFVEQRFTKLRKQLHS